MRIIGEKFDIREIQSKDKTEFENVMRQVETLRSLFDAVPHGIDTFWKIYGESEKNDVFTITDKNDEFVGFIHFELEEGEEQGQLEISVLDNYDMFGFGKELMPEFLNYVYKETGAVSFCVELMDAADASKFIYEEMGYVFDENGVVEIYNDEVKEDHLNKVKELLKSMGIEAENI